ncbi:hypothetical protein MUK42_16853 [Musa troglodytarum]|uniref:Uncharacterized protein n=1 Tax=Musa troglodytarum TaxID=320322 RepID=A0A9E7JV53_9LILI|nr:hypothetical protein MUK42_16853 [Musa troglodytarum]
MKVEGRAEGFAARDGASCFHRRRRSKKERSRSCQGNQKLRCVWELVEGQDTAVADADEDTQKLVKLVHLLLYIAQPLECNSGSGVWWEKRKKGVGTAAGWPGQRCINASPPQTKIAVRNVGVTAISAGAQQLHSLATGDHLAEPSAIKKMPDSMGECLRCSAISDRH